MNDNQINLKNSWTINALLAAILALLCGYYYNMNSQKAYAGTGWDTNGVMALSAAGENERLVIIDTTKQNFMIYKTQGVGQFRLVGARSYKYDVEMDDTAASPYEKSATYGTFLQVYKDYISKGK